MSKVENGQTVNVHYTGTFDDGTKFDSSHDREETLSFQVGSGQVVKGFENAILGMSVGDTKSIQLTPAEAYGDPVQEAIQEVPMTAFPEGTELTEGITIVGQNGQGQQMMGRVVGLTDTTATLDFNHPLAGKNLNFEIELVSID
tara:strand:+ start:135 stop:566 length:432 start_codon:yes stop_codon:yes gene_type:complete